MSELRLATRYAKSMIDIAREQDKLEAINTDMRLLGKVIKSSRDFLLMLRNPVIPTSKKIKIVEQVFKDKVDLITFSFMRLVIQKNREAFLPEVVQSFITQYNKLKKIIVVKFTSAIPVDEELVNRVRKLVEAKTGFTNIELETKVNPNIIGGYILQFEDQMYDASILRHLEVLDDNFLSNIYMKRLGA
jgi:F-type H+-transporting ATPase subunit delta